MERLKAILMETVYRLQCFDIARVESGFVMGRSLIYCFHDVQQELNADLAKTERHEFKVIKGEG
jgi:DUF2075 family protein